MEVFDMGAVLTNQDLLSSTHRNFSRSQMFAPMSRTRVWLVYLSGFLYAISMNKFAMRDALSSGGGIQGVIEAFAVLGSFACLFFAARSSPKIYHLSVTCVCFATFAVFSLISYWRSFNPTLSFVKAVLMLAVIGTCYLACQSGWGVRYFEAIYYGYIAILLLGLCVGFLFPAQYPIITSDEFSGRTRVGVFNTFPGVTGEDSALLLLLVPLLGRRIGWTSQVFLFGMNVLAGGKVGTFVLVLLLLVRSLSGTWQFRSRRTVFVIMVSLLFIGFGSFYFLDALPKNDVVTHFAESIYGTKVSNETSTLDGRLDVWVASLKLIPSAQLLGFGIEGARQKLIQAVWWSGNSHNGYLEVALSAGLLGTLFLLFGVCVVIGVALKSAKGIRRNALFVIFAILLFNLEGPTFIFPSSFGMLIMLWLYYKCKGSISFVLPREDYPASTLV